jgi:hypothetical protein
MFFILDYVNKIQYVKISKLIKCQYYNIFSIPYATDTNDYTLLVGIYGTS